VVNIHADKGESNENKEFGHGTLRKQRDLSVDGKITFKWTSEKSGVKEWT
jgi:hypothetical protein